MEKNNKYNKRKQGSFGERASVNFLKKLGFKIIFCNYRVSRYGEIDIIALDGDCLCFVEVKARSNFNFGTPSESVNYKKREKIKSIAHIFISHNPSFNNTPVRFDIIEIIFEKEIDFINIKKIEIIKNAFY